MSCEESDDPPTLPITIPEEESVSSSFITTYQDSPFYHFFKKAYDNVSEIIEDPVSTDNLKRNGLNVPGIGDYLLRYILPFYPLWSRYLQSMVLPDSANPLSNSAIELRFKLLKTETRVRKRFTKANRYKTKTAPQKTVYFEGNFAENYSNHICVYGSQVIQVQPFFRLPK